VSFGDNPARWAPANRHRHRALSPGLAVGPEEVTAAAARLLASDRVPAHR
jgi:hypothetical protein